MVELVIYLGILTLFAVAIVSGIISQASFFVRSRNERKVSLAAETVLERVVREIRLAKSIHCLTTTGACPAVGSPPSIDPSYTGSVLQLDSFQDYTVQVVATKEIKLDSVGKVRFDPNVTVTGDEQYLTSGDVTVQSLAFTQLADPVARSISQGIRVQMTASMGSGKYQVTHSYYATAILRASYEH